jgi:helix-turn-helix protein
MVPGYYNLNEAAQALGMPPDELRQLAQKNQIRSFQDRGTLRFRQADIQELARRRGATSDPDIVGLAEPKSGPKSGPKSPTAPKTPSAPKSPTPPKSGGPKSPPKSPPKQQPVDAPEIFDFSLEADDKLDIGREHLSEAGPRSGPKSGAKSGPKSGGKKAASGSDSDVKLVGNAGPDSDVRLMQTGPKTPKAPSGQRKSALGPASPSPNKSSRLAGGTQPVDSGVRLVPMDSDSDVKIVGPGASADEIPLGQQPPPSATDSDIRLESVAAPPPPSHDAMMLTDEINLDEEIKKQEAAQKHKPKSRVRPKSELKFPTQSPFELSDSDVSAPTESEKHPSSSDFELTPQAPKPDSSGSVVLEPSSNEDFSLELSDDSGVLAKPGKGELTGPTSGINLSNPVDAGLSLEEGADTEQLDLDLSLEVESTPKPVKREDASDSSSEFELSLEEGAAKSADSDSEFELTLDDSSAEHAAAPASPQAKGRAGEKDIFETDFEVPALEEESGSGSEVAALETSDADLESSDFDLALDDSDLAVEDESGSQVVALDEESADEAAETIAGELGEDLDVGVEEVEEEEEGVGAGPVREVVREKIIEPAPWGAWPTVFMLPCVIVMVVVGIMGFELIQSSAGFKSAGFLTKTLGEMVNIKTR